MNKKRLFICCCLVLMMLSFAFVVAAAPSAKTNGFNLVNWIKGIFSPGNHITGLAFGYSGVGSEFHVSTYTISSQNLPSAAMDDDGDFVIVWDSDAQESGNGGIYGQRYNSAGTAQGGEFHINTYTTAWQREPAVAMDADGDFVVTWMSEGQDTDNDGVYAQRFNSAGVAQGSEFQVNTFITGSQNSPAIAIESNGDFVIVWDSHGQDGGAQGVYGQRYTSAGATIGSEFQINTHTPGSQQSPSVAMDADGDFVVVWTSSAQDAPGTTGVYGQRYTSAGATAGSEFLVNSQTSGNQQDTTVAMDDAGNFVVTWKGDGASGNGVYAQRYDSSGATVGSNFLVNTLDLGSQNVPFAAMDNDGDFIIAWSSDGVDGDGVGIAVQAYDSTGAADGGEFVANTYSTSTQANPTISMDNADNVIIAWSSLGQDGDNFGVYAQLFEPGSPACGSTLTGDVTLTSDITGCSDQGFIIGANDVTIDCAGNTLSGTTGFGADRIAVDNRAGYNGTTVINCVVEDFSYGIRIGEWPNIVTDTHISGNTFDGMINSGIYMIRLNDSNITSNTFTDVTTGILIGGSSTYNNVSHNNFASFAATNAFAAIQIDNNANDNSIRHNTMANPTASEDAQGIYFFGGDANLVADNDISDMRFGMYMVSSNEHNVITRNTITDSTFTGLLISQGTNNTIYDNYFDNEMNVVDRTGTPNNWYIPQTTGPNIIGGTDIGGNYYAGEYVGLDTDGDGIGETNLPYHIDGDAGAGDALPLTLTTVGVNDCGKTITTSTTLTGNLNCPGDGIIIGADSITLDCAGFTITGDGGRDEFFNDGGDFGIHNGPGVEHNSVTVKNCIIEDFDAGIYYNDASGGLIEGNTLRDNTAGMFGFSLTGGLNISLNEITNNMERGAALGISSGRIEWNNIHGNGFLSTGAFNVDHGLVVFSGSNTIANNTVHNNSDFGIRLDLSSSVGGNTVADNEVYENRIGIIGSGRLNTFERNDVHDNTATGMSISQLWHTIRLNEVYDNGGGISASMNAGHVLNNTVYNNNLGGPGSGISVGGPSHNFKYNIVYGHDAEGLIVNGDTQQVTDNHVWDNDIGISVTSGSDGNNITNNRVNGSTTVGIKLDNADTNTIYNNVFINTVNADESATSLSNNWNIAQQTGPNLLGGNDVGGNFWSDYLGLDTDGDGLGETLLPYNTGMANGADNLPMTLPPVCGNGVQQGAEQCDGADLAGESCATVGPPGFTAGPLSCFPAGHGSECMFDTSTCLGDTDGDTIADTVDNCVNDFNPFQDDLDLDTVGDVCDDCPATTGTGTCTDPTDSAAEEIDASTGGMLSTPSGDAAIDVPAGALPANTTVTIEDTGQYQSNFAGISGVYAFSPAQNLGPPGTTFSPPAEICFIFPSYGLDCATGNFGVGKDTDADFVYDVILPVSSCTDLTPGVTVEACGLADSFSTFGIVIETCEKGPHVLGASASGAVAEPLFVEGAHVLTYSAGPPLPVATLTAAPGWELFDGDCNTALTSGAWVPSISKPTPPLPWSTEICAHDIGSGDLVELRSIVLDPVPPSPVVVRTMSFDVVASGSLCEICGDGTLNPGEVCDFGPGSESPGGALGGVCNGGPGVCSQFTEVCRNDCQSLTCEDVVGVQQPESFLCDDGEDNDCDTFTDCDDSDCDADAACNFCGNGFQHPPEECDDGNNFDDDGCSSDCLVEFCGDSVVQLGLGEECDDGNNIPGDGCDENCQLEVSVCAGDCNEDGFITIDDFSTLGFYFGAAVPAPANCDVDGDLSPIVNLGDLATFISNYDANGPVACDGSSVCGNNVVEIPEQCEPGLDPECHPNCVQNICGDGDQSGSESCDLGGTCAADGATPCTSEFDCLSIGILSGNFACNPGTPTCNALCEPTSVELPEGCAFDMTGNLLGFPVDGVFCDIICTGGFTGVTYSGSTFDAPFCACTDPIPPFDSDPATACLLHCGSGLFTGICEYVPPSGFCGDGTVGPGEECDDGNTVSGDGCSDLCVIEFCGDGTHQPGIGEECDDGNTNSGDGCSNVCVVEFCGDGTHQPGLGEECDDGNNNDEDGCSASCIVEFCGDGIPQAGLGEQCDDGNTVPGDGCDELCQLEIECTISESYLVPGSCDDGIDNDCDGLIDSQEVPCAMCGNNVLEPTPGSCGDGTCDEPPETAANCPADCAVTAETCNIDFGEILGGPLDEPTCNALCQGTLGGPPYPGGPFTGGFVDGDLCICEGADASSCDITIPDSLCWQLVNLFGLPTTNAGNCYFGPTPTGGGPSCGDGTVDPGEQCDDGNNNNGDGCDAFCNLEAGGLTNDFCGNAEPIFDGLTPYSNLGATDDGPANCAGTFGSDIWYTYTSTCTGTLALSVSTCNDGNPSTGEADYDTAIAIYDGTACPAGLNLACNDDAAGCAGFTSVAEADVVVGNDYLIQVGGYSGDQGTGVLSITCTPPGPVCGDAICEPDENQGGPFECEPDCGPFGGVCGDLICDQPLEDVLSCPIDCFCGDGVCDALGFEDQGGPFECEPDCGPFGPVCGANGCEPGEEQGGPFECETDCGPFITCGDFICEPGEEQFGPFECEADCGPFPPTCGDLICEPGEEQFGPFECETDCGPFLTCGNGVVDPSEDCDSSAGKSGSFCPSGGFFSCLPDCTCPGGGASYLVDPVPPLFFDISATGIPLPLGDDDFIPFPLPFPFDFYDSTYFDVNIVSNGFVTFDPVPLPTGFFAGTGVLPDPSAPNDVIAVQWDDLDPSVGGIVFYEEFPGGCPNPIGGPDPCVIVQYDHVPYYAGPDSGLYQIILYANGNILLEYLVIDMFLSPSGIPVAGIENVDGTDGITVHDLGIPAVPGVSTLFTRVP